MHPETAPAGRRILIGCGLLLVTLILWLLRDRAPTWFAKSVTATAEITTTTERDDSRVTRAFAAAKRTSPFDAGLDPVPNGMKLIRKSRLWVRAASEAQAVAQATAMTNAMSAAFEREGPGQLRTDVRRRATPNPDETTIFVGRAIRAIALAALLLGLALIVTGARRVQAGPDRQSVGFWWALAGGLALFLGPVLLPGKLAGALMIMAVPGMISGLIVYRTMMVHNAATWPSTRARITKSEMREEYDNHADVTTAINVPVVEYEYTLGDRTFQGTHVSGADNIGTRPQAQETLDHYSLGATVPVYYNPKNPDEAVLERDLPWSLGFVYTTAVAIFMAGVAAAAAFWNVDEIMGTLRDRFPDGAEPQGTIFFGLCGLWTLFFLWSSRRDAAQAAGWPTTQGHIVSSAVESYKTRVGGRSGSRVTLFEAVVEYSYEAKGRNYHSTQLAFGPKASGGQGAAEAKAAQYRPGSSVVVHYDPKNPSNAVLETKVAFGWFVLVLALIFFGLAVFFSAALR